MANTKNISIVLAILSLLPVAVCSVIDPDYLMLHEADATLRDAKHRIYMEERVTDLMYHAATGDLEQLEKALKSGANPNRRTENGYTAVMFSAETGNLAATKMLVDHGADIESRTKSGYTALFVAAYDNKLYEEALLEHRGLTYVGEHNQSGVMEYLISLDAPIRQSMDTPNDTENTAHAFYNIARVYEGAGSYALARENYDIAMESFIQTSELYATTSARRAQHSAQVRRFLGAIQPAVQAVNNQLQADRMATASAVGQARGQDLTYTEFLDLQKESQARLEAIASTSSVAAGTATSPIVSTSESPIYLIIAEANMQRALVIGITLQCYDRNNVGDDLMECVDRANDKFDQVKISERLALETAIKQL